MSAGAPKGARSASAIRAALDPADGLDPVLFGLVTPSDQNGDGVASMTSFVDGWQPVLGAPAAFAIPFGFCGPGADDAYVVLDADQCAPFDTRGRKMLPPDSDGNVVGSLAVSVASSVGPEDELKCRTRYAYRNAVAVRVPQSSKVDAVVAVVFADDPPWTVHYGLASEDFGFSVAERELQSDVPGQPAGRAIVVAVPESGIHRVLYCARMVPVFPGHKLSYFVSRPVGSPFETLFKFPAFGGVDRSSGIYGVDLGSAGPVHFPDARWSNMLSSSYSAGTAGGGGVVTLHTKGVRCVGDAVDPVFLGADANGDVRVDLSDPIESNGYALVSGCSFVETEGPNAGRTCVGFAEPGSAEMGAWLHKPGAWDFPVRSFAGGGGGLLDAVSDWFSDMFSTTREASAVIVYSVAGGKAYETTDEVRVDDFSADAAGALWLARKRDRQIPDEAVSVVPVPAGPDQTGVDGMAAKIEDAVATSKFTFISVSCHGSPNGRLCIGGGISPDVISSAIERGAARADGNPRRVFIIVTSCHSGDFFDGWAPSANLSVLIWSSTGSDNVAYGVGGTRAPWNRIYPDARAMGIAVIDDGMGRTGGIGESVFLSAVAKAVMGVTRKTYSQVFAEAKASVAEATAIREREYNKAFGSFSPTRMHQVPDADSNGSFESDVFMN